MNNNSKFAASLLIGAAAGAAIAMYLTSESGSKLRQTVAEKANDLFNDLKEKAGSGKDAMAIFADKLSSAGESFSKKATTATSNAAKSASELYM